jgi:pyridoxine 4-dehydrogenase
MLIRDKVDPDMPDIDMSAGTITIGDNLVVDRVGFGAMQLTGNQVWGEYPDRDGAVTLLRAAVDAGVTFIDTADV